ncbi:hypothetical protein C8F04DRAFT_1141897 [Mycena alexandri]|uniref:Uncharacterized protein n=1 Tax=Mycena alexandri TaxID=1745969 RepID=A0AAD6WQ74_9AGAR|nr:hypothetical protein C8F04DRAFT_1141897 [Mycena alexandri]
MKSLSIQAWSKRPVPEEGEYGNYLPTPFHLTDRIGRRFNPQAFLWKLTGWPGIVIAGQIMLQMAAWTFFAVVRRKGSIPLEWEAAAWVQSHPHTVTFCFTQISTILAATSSFLFSFGVRQSIALHMHGDGMSLGSFISTIKIASRGLILNPRKRRWSTMSIVIFFLTGVQTSGWASLLTPLTILIDTPLTGHELDLTNPQLGEVDSSDLYLCVVNSSFLRSLVVGQTESGYAMANLDFNFSTTYSIMGQSFYGSSGGILPTDLGDVDASTWFPNIPIIPSTINATQSVPDGLSYNYTLHRQGFTANVSCQPQQLTPDTTPSMVFQTDTVKEWNGGYNLGNVTWTRVSSTCDTDQRYQQLNHTVAYTLSDYPNYMLMVACASGDSYKLIFQSAGLYDTMSAVCTLTPQILNVTVYSDGTIISVSPKYEEAIPEGGGPAGISAVTTIYNMMFFSQTALSNTVGDQLSSLVNQWSRNYSDVDAALGFMEIYLRGVAEYSGSVFRACVSGRNSTFPDGPRLDLTTPLHGMLFTQTMGWNHADTLTLLGLIPGTIVALLTIYIVVMAVAHHAEDPQGQPFDPSDARHLVAASAAGGLGSVFKGTEERDIQVAERVNIFLEALPGQLPALRTTAAV